LRREDDIIVAFEIVIDDILLIGVDDRVYVVQAEVIILMKRVKCLDFLRRGTGIVGCLVITGVYFYVN